MSDDSTSWSYQQRHTIIVLEQNRTTRDTGLLDKDGNKITVEEKHEPMGFVHFKEK